MCPTSVKPGDVLAGKYRIERLLGSGGMGYVMAARHLQLDQLVAMKFLRKGAADNPEAGARFLREAKAAAKLRSENIAKIYDVGTLESGEPYIVMEHLEGRDLSAISKEQLLPPSEACEYVMQACEALAEAHALGIIHRDIKLANLFVTSGPAGSPLVKVLDFGISKTNPFGESEHEITHAASLLGSPRFMSPEQMRDARAVDGRTDVWSLGVVLYRVVAGKPPFEADSLGRLLSMVMHEKEAPLSSIVKDLPPGFEEVVARCLEKEPAARFPNVAELALALVPFCADETRARSSADRIAAVLHLPKRAPNSADRTGMTPHASARASAPPGVKDTGTAAPWVGTHGSGRSRTPKASVGIAVMFAVLFVAIITSGAFFARAHHDEGVATTASAAPAETRRESAVPAPAPIPPSPPGTEGTPATSTPVLPLPVAVVAESPRQVTAPHVELAPRVELAPSTAKRTTPPTTRPKTTPPSRPAAPVSTGKSDDGIPRTRE